VSHVAWIGWEDGRATPIEAMRRALATWSHGEVPERAWRLGKHERKLTKLAAKVRPHAFGSERSVGGHHDS